MGAKQSKRSVDISGKEAEGGGEVAVAGAGGEGRVEQLADADALKPQLNGAAHIQLEQTDKEKELDSGTPENEKDATTEKEGKEADESEKEAAPVTNGETETKVENGESTPTPEDGKKPKKEKVKKKWSLRSISFSRKDKPKQEKKQKDEEPKTNGEPEKVPEETAEAVPEATANEVAEEAKAPAEEKDEKTPETPVTEPLTNGTSTPESIKAETPASEEAAPAPSSPAEKVESAPEPQPEPEQLPVNGLSLEESKPEIPVVEKLEETKPEPPAAETAEIVPAPEIPKEVCVEQLPLLEPTPPPLPANPPPSSVASFAATTMAPELTDASLANTADSAIAPLSALPETKDIIVQPELPTETAVNKFPENEIPFVLKENNEDAPAVTICESEVQNQNNALEATIITKPDVSKQVDEAPKPDIDVIIKETITEAVVTETEITTAENSEVKSQALVTETMTDTVVTENSETVTETVVPTVSKSVIPEPTQIEIPDQSEHLESKTRKLEPVDVDIEKIEAPAMVPSISELNTETETVPTEDVQNKNDTPVQANGVSVVTESLPEPENIPESEVDISEADDSSLPPPPMQDEDDSAPPLDEVDDKVEESLKQIPEPITETEQAIIESKHISNAETTNGVHDSSPDAADDTNMLKKKGKAALASAAETVECNGGAGERAADSPRLPNGAAAPPAALHTPQEPLPVSDKLADLIPEVPDVPELKPETLQETVTDVAVAN